jgi:predicted NBD/HSP70 family sugar kinase
LREANLALVVRTVFGSAVPLSRAGVATATSLTRSTVSRLADDLIAGGMLQELEPLAVAGPGRPATPLVPARARIGALGLQVNAGYLAVRLVDLTGEVIGESLHQEDLIGSRPAATLHRLGRMAEAMLEAAPAGLNVVGAGLALPGIVSVEEGRLLHAPNLGWSDVVPSSTLMRHVGHLAVRVGNEADLAAHAVAEPAPGRPGASSDFIYLSGEIGIGGAAVVNGHVMRGRHGWAGEIGHVCVDPDGPACRCGSTGCLEQYAGRRALLTSAGLAADAAPDELAKRVAGGDRTALRAISAAARALGIALAGVVNVLDIPRIVLGGHLGQVADLLRPELEKSLAGRVLSARWVTPEIHTAPRDAAPGATGAALLALSNVLSDPAHFLDAAPTRVGVQPSPE